jgi:hypothetical protein
MMKILPPTEESNEWRGDILVPDVPHDAELGVQHSIAVTKSTLWKHDIMIRFKGQLNEERAIIPGGHPRWILGERADGVEPGTVEVLLAKLVVERYATIKIRHNVSAIVVRVAADAYDAARRWNSEVLAVAYGVRYERTYEAERRRLRVTGESPGAVGIYSFRHFGQGRDLRQTGADKESRRLPVDKVDDLTALTDWHMDVFAVKQHLQDMADVLGLRPRYEKLKSRHTERWRPPPGPGATQ